MFSGSTPVTQQTHSWCPAHGSLAAFKEEGISQRPPHPPTSEASRKPDPVKTEEGVQTTSEAYALKIIEILASACCSSSDIPTPACPTCHKHFPFHHTSERVRIDVRKCVLTVYCSLPQNLTPTHHTHTHTHTHR